jgi:GNAT superfamily N-acetyltransferase
MPGPAYYLRALKRHYASGGLGGMVKGMFKRIAAAVYLRSDEVVIYCDLSGVKEDFTRRLTLEPMTDANRPLLEQFIVHHISVDKRQCALDYLASGYRALILLADGKCFGYTWSFDHTVPPHLAHPHLERLAMPLSPGDTYMFDLFVQPEYRGKGVATEFFKRAMWMEKEMGYTRAWGMVLATNTPARQLYRTLGWVDRDVYRTRLFFSRFLYCNGRWYIKNNLRTKPLSFDFRPVGRA